MTNASPTVLLADDDPCIRGYLTHLLVHEGYQVAEAEDGDQALLLFGQTQPQIALLDALMPGTDGFECCRRLRALDANLPCLMITSLEDQASVDKAFAAGASDYMTKPIHWPIMRQRIQHLIKARQNLLNLRQQAAREQALNRIVRAIPTSLQLDQILAAVTREIGHLLEADRVSISIYQPQQQHWRIVSEYSTQQDGYLGSCCRKSWPEASERQLQGSSRIFSLAFQPQPLLTKLAGWEKGSGSPRHIARRTTPSPPKKTDQRYAHFAAPKSARGAE